MAAADLLEGARRRATELRPQYRASGAWTADRVDVVRAAARRRPEDSALISRGRQLTYARLDAETDRAAATLHSAGVGDGSVVLLVVGNDIGSVIAIHAALRLDAVVLLVARNSGAAQIAEIAADAGAQFGVWPGPAPGTLPQAGAELRWIRVDAAPPAAAPPPPQPRRAADEPSIVLYTSGTTSRPKGVVHSLSTLGKAATNYIEGAGLTEADRIFLISPLASVTGVLQALFVAPLLGIAAVLEDRWDPASTCELLRTTESTWYGGPDRLLDRLLDEAVAAGVSVPLRAVFLGGTMLDRGIVERIENDFGIVVLRAYGSSEVPVSTCGRRTESAARRHADDGAPLGDVEVRLGSAAEPTECCIRGPHTFLGYTDGADDHGAFEGRWYRTGDAADFAGGRVRVVGRLRDIVIRNGLKIPMAEVDEAVAHIPGVRDCAAYAVPDPETGERLAIAVVLESAVASLSLAELAGALLAAGLPKFKLPEEVVFWAQPLPMNANGKVERSKLHSGSEGQPRELAQRLSAAG